MKKYILTFLLLVSWQGFAKNNEPIPKPVLSASDSVFHIAGHFGDKIYLTGGTGFLIGDNLFVTNFHILNSFKKNNFLKDESFENIDILHKNKPSELKIKRIVSLSRIHDLAVLEVEDTRPTYKTPLKRSALPFRDSPLVKEESFFAVGYPIEQFYILESLGPLQEHSDNFLFYVDFLYVFGLSGGALLDSKGQVVGVVHSVFDNLVMATKFETLKSMLSNQTMAVSCDHLSIKDCFDQSFDDLIMKAEEGHTQAQFVLGEYYWKKYVVYYQQDESSAYNFLHEALMWFEKSAEQGNVHAQFSLVYALIFREKADWKKQHKKLIDWLQPGLEAGYPSAKYLFAQFYIQYELIAEDGNYENYKKAEELIIDLARQEFIPARMLLNKMYKIEEGVE